MYPIDKVYIYRKEIVRQVLACMDDVPCKMSILTTIEMVHKEAWGNVSPQTMANCFSTCDFIKEEQTIVKDNSIQ